MAPKKKGGKKQGDDWEADLGETIDPIAQATQDAKNADADADGATNGADDGEEAGGLMAALRKNKRNRAKKGKVDNDFVEGEDPAQTASPAPEADLNGKAPEEATFDDEDVFAGTGAKKGKGGKKQSEKPAPAPASDDEEGGGLKTAKEKEKERKERERQRKKEQVCHSPNCYSGSSTGLIGLFSGCQKEDHRPNARPESRGTCETCR